MAPVTLLLRSETKPLEHRSALSPAVVRKLVANGFTINVERSPVRIFDDQEFVEAGATLVEEGSWPQAPADQIVIGLKELEDRDPFPLKHEHIQFSHSYKNQTGWQERLARFARGCGSLLDLEYLAHPNGRRVAAFGYHAGYAGTALALLDWAWQLDHSEPLSGKTPYSFKADLDKEVTAEVARGAAKNGNQMPRVLVIGARGRCGTGSLDMCREAGIPEENLLKWDMDETKKGGPFEEIRDVDIFVNCIYLDQPIPKFVTTDFLRQGRRNLSVVCDVSCDTTNENNPIPFCDTPTYFNKPTIRVPGFSDPPLSYITIDHLPSLLPREASEAFSEDLLPSLLQLPDRETAPVWVGAKKLFQEKLALVPASMR